MYRTYIPYDTSTYEGKKRYLEEIKEVERVREKYRESYVHIKRAPFSIPDLPSFFKIKDKYYIRYNTGIIGRNGPIYECEDLDEVKECLNQIVREYEYRRDLVIANGFFGEAVYAEEKRYDKAVRFRKEILEEEPLEFESLDELKMYIKDIKASEKALEEKEESTELDMPWLIILLIVVLFIFCSTYFKK